MNKKLLVCAVILSFLVNLNLFAQTERDSTDEKDHPRKWYRWDNYEWLDWEFHGRPFIEVNYGLGTANHDKLVSKFADVGAAELKMGYSTQESFMEDYIVDFHDNYSFVSKTASDLKSNSAKLGDMKSEMWRFGFANRKGYGYKFGGVSILPYHGRGFAWSKLDMKDYPANFFLLVSPKMSLDDATSDTDILNRFHDAFRFGTVSEGGIKIDFASSVSLDVAYEAAVIFPRYLFWKHAGSFIIEEASMGLLNHFIDKVADSSPYAGPIVNFLLKNGLSYAFFSLKKANMNWPFATESPLTYETVKFGMTFTF